MPARRRGHSRLRFQCGLVAHRLIRTAPCRRASRTAGAIVARYSPPRKQKYKQKQQHAARQGAGSFRRRRWCNPGQDCSAANEGKMEKIQKRWQAERYANSGQGGGHDSTSDQERRWRLKEYDCAGHCRGQPRNHWSPRNCGTSQQAVTSAAEPPEKHRWRTCIRDRLRKNFHELWPVCIQLSPRCLAASR